MWRWREEWRAHSERGLDGSAVAYNADTLVGWEFSRIVSRNGSVRYEGAPNGQPMHVFPLAVNARDSAVFSDPAFAYPQRIVYQRRGADSLLARAEGTVAGSRRVDTYALARVPCRADSDLVSATALRDSLQLLLDSLRSSTNRLGISAAVGLPDGRVITLVSGLADTTRPRGSAWRCRRTPAISARLADRWRRWPTCWPNGPSGTSDASRQAGPTVHSTGHDWRPYEPQGGGRCYNGTLRGKASCWQSQR